MDRLEFELAYYDSTVQRINHYTMRTPNLVSEVKDSYDGVRSDRKVFFHLIFEKAYPQIQKYIQLRCNLLRNIQFSFYCSLIKRIGYLSAVGVRKTKTSLCGQNEMQENHLRKAHSMVHFISVFQPIKEKTVSLCVEPKKDAVYWVKQIITVNVKRIKPALFLFFFLYYEMYERVE